jgi:hypothetical protein
MQQIILTITKRSIQRPLSSIRKSLLSSAFYSTMAQKQDVNDDVWGKVPLGPPDAILGISTSSNPLQRDHRSL